MVRWKKRLAAFAIAQGAIVLFALMLATTSVAAAPKGNSGTVKVDGIPFAEQHANEPHPSCDFRITFWGYGEGREATATFAMHAPTKETTGPGSITYGPIDTGTDPAGGGNDPDGEIVLNLASFLEDSGATAHEQQGFHVKLTVNATGSQGADVKHKVFWVTCESEVEGTTTPQDDDTEVLGGRQTRDLPRTGSPTGWASVIAAQMLLLGVAMVTASRRPRAVTSSAGDILRAR